MKKRIITVIATYDLEDEELIGVELTPTEEVEGITKKHMEDYFCWDEGFEKLEVTCEDIEV